MIATLDRRHLGVLRFADGSNARVHGGPVGGVCEARSMTTGWRTWSPSDTRSAIAVPQAGDDKYSRGVLGVLTGSDTYPGAAVLSVEGAVRTGLGMVRYVGGERAASFVLHRRPEAVTAPGRVQAWLLGSGVNDPDANTAAAIRAALDEGLPTVLDAGALAFVDRAPAGIAVVTPHHGEAAKMLERVGRPTTREAVAADPRAAAETLAEATGAVVLLKGATTHVAGHGIRLSVEAGPPWVATAGAGDVLGGVLGAFLATHSEAILRRPERLALMAAAAAHLHGEAGRIASGGGPIAALDIAEALPYAVRALIDGSP